MKSWVGAFRSNNAWWSYVRLSVARRDRLLTWAEQYSVLFAYYINNGLYDSLRSALTSTDAAIPADTLKALYNPTYRVVEFYASKLWPGPLDRALPLMTDNPVIEQPIRQIWQWSNWASEKQGAARSFATYGDLFLRVAGRREGNGAIQRVFIQNLDPRSVTEIRSDERGFLTYARLDVPQQRKVAGQVQDYVHTEEWDKETQTFRRWEHTQSAKTLIEQLPEPQETRPFAYFGGIDFIPIVWQPFRHIGDERGMAAITPGIDKIDEANLMATRLHQMLYRYNKPMFVAGSDGKDSAGRPLPAPKVGGDTGKLEMSDDPNEDDIIRLPGFAWLESMVPDISYNEALGILRDQMSELAEDLPEMVYASIQNKDGLAAQTVHYMLDAAISKLLEARGNAEAALVRANQMALTIGQGAGLWRDLGDYNSGTLDHSFEPRPVLDVAEMERASTMATYVGADIPVSVAARRVGWSDSEVEELETAQRAEEQRAQEQAAAGNDRLMAVRAAIQSRAQQNGDQQ